jgi:hypothetical protein
VNRKIKLAAPPARQGAKYQLGLVVSTEPVLPTADAQIPERWMSWQGGGDLVIEPPDLPVAAQESGSGPNPPDRVRGRVWQLCPGTSDVDFLGDLKRVVDLNAEVAYGAFDPRVAE